MPDFTARFRIGAVLDEWLDPPRPAETQGPDDPGAPSRLSPRPGYPHKRWKAAPNAVVEIAATVLIGGAPAEIPDDSELDGRLFSCWVVESPDGAPLLSISSSAGESARQSFIPILEGHYCIGIARQGGGAVLMHLDVEAP